MQNALKKAGALSELSEAMKSKAMKSDGKNNVAEEEPGAGSDAEAFLGEVEEEVASIEG